jgi:hypothetical protein
MPTRRGVRRRAPTDDRDEPARAACAGWTSSKLKLLPQPEERSPADRLNAYVARAADRVGW